MHSQYVKERANAIVKEANDSPLTRVMQVLKQAVEDDRHHKCCVLCKEVAMNGFHLLHRCENHMKLSWAEEGATHTSCIS